MNKIIYANCDICDSLCSEVTVSGLLLEYKTDIKKDFFIICKTCFIAQTKAKLLRILR